VRRAAAIAILALGLAGCHSSQERQHAACLEEAGKETSRHHYRSPAEEGNLVSICMFRHGYEFVVSPNCEKAIPDAADRSASGELVLLNRRAMSSICYQSKN
jgi:hypothetical protein